MLKYNLLRKNKMKIFMWKGSLNNNNKNAENRMITGNSEKTMRHEGSKNA